MLGINETANNLGLRTICVKTMTSIFDKSPLPKMKKDSKEVEYAFTCSNHIKLFSNDKHQLFILMKNGIAQIR